MLGGGILPVPTLNGSLPSACPSPSVLICLTICSADLDSNVHSLYSIDIARYPEISLNPGDELEINYLTGTPNDFAAFLLNGRLEFEILDNEIQQHYSVPENVIRPAEVKFGDFLIVLCIPLEGVDEKWTRVQVNREATPPSHSAAEAGKTYEVLCVDFGNIISVSLDKMSVIERRFCALVRQAYHFQLCNRQGVTYNEWSDAAVGNFVEIASFWTPMKVTVMERGAYHVLVWTKIPGYYEDLAEGIRES